MALHQLQDMETPEEIVLGVSVLFGSICRRLGLDASEVHAMGLKVIDTPSEGDAHTNGAVEVVRDFAQTRIMGQQGTLG